MPSFRQNSTDVSNQVNVVSVCRALEDLAVIALCTEEAPADIEEVEQVDGLEDRAMVVKIWSTVSLNIACR